MELKLLNYYLLFSKAILFLSKLVKDVFLVQNPTSIN